MPESEKLDTVLKLLDMLSVQVDTNAYDASNACRGDALRFRRFEPARWEQRNAIRP